MKAVLDASALLALLFREPGWEPVAQVMNDACISTVNVSEVLARFARDGQDPDALLQQLQRTGLTILAFSETQAAAAGRMAPLVRDQGLSLGDRACLALAVERGLPALTADRPWGDIDVGARIQLIR